MSNDDDLREDPLYPTAISEAEAAAGFALGSIPNPPGTHANNPYLPMPKRTAAIVRPLANELVAVKVAPPRLPHETARVEYAIFSVDGRPVQSSAQSLDALLVRFPQQQEFAETETPKPGMRMAHVRGRPDTE